MISGCAFFQKPDQPILPNEWTGYSVRFASLDKDYKQSRNFNEIWEKFHGSGTKPYYKFLDQSFRILGTFVSENDEYLVIENSEGHRFKMPFDFDPDYYATLPPYMVFDDHVQKVSKMVGDTLWLNYTHDYAFFYTFETYTFKRFEPVTVVDVDLFQNQGTGTAIWLKVKAKNGLFAFVRFNGNEPKLFGKQDYYFTQNPLPKSWGKKMIQKVKRKQIEKGMTLKQVRHALGNPNEIHTTTSRYGMGEQWVYGTSLSNKIYYLFEHGILTQIQ